MTTESPRPIVPPRKCAVCGKPLRWHRYRMKDVDDDGLLERVYTHEPEVDE